MNILKRLLICSALLSGLFLFSPGQSFGQYIGSGYNGGLLLTIESDLLLIIVV